MEGPNPPGPHPGGLRDRERKRAPYRREGFGLEFDRVAVFADAVYAIALTLIVVGIEVPTVSDPSSNDALLDALNDQMPSIVMFFIAFLVIGAYWMAHHGFVALLGQVDSRFIALHLLYLSLIAFLPFPAAVLGQFDGNGVAVSVFAVTMAATSGMETVLYLTARSRGLFEVQLPEAVFKWAIIGSLVPVVTFLLSVPIAFFDAYLAMVFWVVSVPAGMLTAYLERAERHRVARLEPAA